MKNPYVYDLRGKLRDLGLGVDYYDVRLKPHSDKWADAFAEINDYLTYRLEQQGLHKKHNFLIKHIGSTSLDDIWAKPVIDFALVIKDTDGTSETTNTTRSVLNMLNGSQLFDEKDRLRDGMDAVYGIMHFGRCYGDALPSQYKKQVMFRQYLCDNLSARTEYEGLKLRLAAGHYAYYDFSERKKDFVYDTVMAAERKYSKSEIDEMCLN